eukprot:TRINITY_DN1101_c0_g1_i2.p1 TRINITY_DN1101_c0_g1~~TRINITY_DN1101_c0_g1_i2.p1  ORF type:complete len:406 (-),score=122.81 TRINITY_DN1101_c0_g1_i2:95-1312(-)
MATARPVVSVHKFDSPDEKSGTLPMPVALTSPLRPDLVRYVHKNVSKNRRQAYAVSPKAGYDTAAESWCTGRAVARIPRAPGGGTHRAGQGAFGNMCRGGGMFQPTKTWRRWHRRVNVTQKRHAVVSALAASSLPPLVMARGHRIGEVSELPLVISEGAEGVSKTKEAVAMLTKLGCSEELQRVLDSKKVRKGKGKMRNRRYVMRKGPLVVYAEDNGIVRAMRNIPGVETACVTRLNLLSLAPGGQFGRFVIWTEGAFKKLTAMYGSLKSGAPMKKGYTLLRPQMENADVARIINSDEVQSVLRPKLEAPKKFAVKRNPLKNKAAMEKLNPGATQKRLLRKRACEKGTTEQKLVADKKKARIASSKKYNTAHKKGDETFYKNLMKAFAAKTATADEAEEGEADEE